MNDKWQEADWSLFALGALDGSTQREMHEHLLTRCRECSRSYEEAVLVMDSLAGTVPQHQPSPHIADALLSRITRPAPSVVPITVLKNRRAPALPWIAAAACALLALWLGVRLEQATNLLGRQRASSQPAAVHEPAKTLPGLASPSKPQTSPSNPSRTTVAGVSGERAQVHALTAELADLQTQKDEALAQLNQSRNDLTRLMEERNSLQTQLASAQEQMHAARNDARSRDAQLSSLTDRLATTDGTIAELRASKAWNAQVVAFLQAGPARQVELRGVDPGAGKATGIAFYAPDRGLLVLARWLPRLEGEKCYQLWSLHKAGPAIRSVGLMKTDGSGGGFLYAPPEQDLRQLTALAITDEPKGGSVSARGHKLLFGALN
jgi:anti-sigma-K factor RskA